MEIMPENFVSGRIPVHGRQTQGDDSDGPAVGGLMNFLNFKWLVTVPCVIFAKNKN